MGGYVIFVELQTLLSLLCEQVNEKIECGLDKTLANFRKVTVVFHNISPLYNMIGLIYTEMCTL